MNLTVSDFKNRLKTDPAGFYLFYGEEAYLKQHYLQALRNAVLPDPALATFNHIRLDADSYSLDALEKALESPPMFNPCKLVEVHELAFSACTEEEIEKLLALCRAYQQDVGIVTVFFCEEGELDAGLPNRPTKLFKQLSEVLFTVAFPKETPARLCRWIGQHFAAEQIAVTPACAEQMLAYCGRDMCVLSSEMEKLTAYLKSHGEKELQPEYIPLVCAHNLEYDTFDFANAILDGNLTRAFEIFADLKAQQQKAELIFGSISRVYCDLARVRTLLDAGAGQSEIAQQLGMHSYKVQLYQRKCEKTNLVKLVRAVDLCQQTDVKLKSSSIDPYILMERLMIAVATA